MPTLDPDLDAFDPDFLDTISVVRRKEAITAKGRDATTDVQTDGVNAVVCIASGSQLERVADYDAAKKYISITTQFRLQLATKGQTGDPAGTQYKNDQVIWKGTLFEVIDLGDDANYGQGWTEAIASAISFQDAPPTPFTTIPTPWPA